MTDTKYQFKSLEERCMTIKNNMPSNYPNSGGHETRIWRLLKDIEEIARVGYYTQCSDYEDEKRSQEEYAIMLQTCQSYMNLVEAEIVKYCKILPRAVCLKWGETDLNYYNEEIEAVSNQLSNLQNMQKIVKRLWFENVPV